MSVVARRAAQRQQPSPRVTLSSWRSLSQDFPARLLSGIPVVVRGGPAGSPHPETLCGGSSSGGVVQSRAGFQRMACSSVSKEAPAWRRVFRSTSHPLTRALGESPGGSSHGKQDMSCLRQPERARGSWLGSPERGGNLPSLHPHPTCTPSTGSGGSSHLVNWDPCLQEWARAW